MLECKSKKLKVIEFKDKKLKVLEFKDKKLKVLDCKECKVPINLKQNKLKNLSFDNHICFTLLMLDHIRKLLNELYPHLFFSLLFKTFFSFNID